SLVFESGKTVLALLGKVSGKTLKKLDISQDVFHAVADWDKLLEIAMGNDIKNTDLVKFPPVKRDLALLISRDIKYQQIEELAFATEKKLLQKVNLFDIYEGEKLGDKKSYAVSFPLQNSEATLTDKQIEAVMDKHIHAYREKLG